MSYLNSNEITVGVNIGPISQAEKETENTCHDHTEREEIAHVYPFTDCSPVHTQIPPQ